MATKLAIDMGSSFTEIYQVGSGIVLEEPTVVAVSSLSANSVKAVGYEAKRLIGKTADNTKIVFPVFEGDIVNEKLSSKLLAEFLKKIEYKSGLSSGKTVVAVPCGAEAESLMRYEKVFSSCGLSKVAFVEAPLLAAIGQRVQLTESTPCFVIDMGGGTTNIAALSLGGIIAGISVNFGGNKIDVELIDYIADKYSLQIGLLTAEKLKIEVGSLLEKDGLTTVINGRDVLSGKPRSMAIRADEILPVIKQYYDKVAELALSMLSKLSPEVSAEIRHSGLYVTGGGAKMVGLEDYFIKKFNMNINVADEPQLSVVLGGGIALGNDELLKKIKINL